jgi:hypothetical protein
MSALRDRIVEIRSRPTTADIGVKALVKKLKDEFGEDVNTKTVRQHLEETEKASAPQTAPTNVTAVVSAVPNDLQKQAYETNSRLLALRLLAMVVEPCAYYPVATPCTAETSLSGLNTRLSRRKGW